MRSDRRGGVEMSIVLAAAAIIAAVVFVAAGLFSLAALLWGDLLELDPPAGTRANS